MMIKRLFNWIFKDDLNRLKEEINIAETTRKQIEDRLNVFNRVLEGIDVSVDVHEYDNRYSPSWAVISLQGRKSDYIKFVALGEKDMNEIARFLRQFERRSNVKVDASPMCSGFLRSRRF